MNSQRTKVIFDEELEVIIDKEFKFYIYKKIYLI